jgi:hypothetical protein
MSDRMQLDRRKAVIRKIVDIFNTGDLSDVDQIFFPDYLDHQRPAGMEIKGPNEFNQIVREARNSSRELKVTIEDLIAEEGKAAGRLQWSITDLCGKTIERETIDILLFANEQVGEHWGAEAWRRK